MQKSKGSDDQDRVLGTEGSWVRRTALACFFLSGISGLIYEVIWTRMLGLVFGNTVFATSTVLTAYMAGLALGSYLFGRNADRIKRSLKTYAILQICIGIYCFFFPYLVKLLGEIYPYVQRALEPSFYSFSFIRFILCGILLLIPTTLMGATMPVFSRFYIGRRFEDKTEESLRQDAGSFGHGVGLIYSVNTFGAFLGTILAGFSLIPSVGVPNTISIAVAGNILVGIVCLLIDRKRPSVELKPAKVKRSVKGVGSVKQKKHSTGKMPTTPLPKSQQAILVVIMAGLAVSGFSAFVYEVAWTRILVMIIGSSVYAFSIMLATFLLGLAIGSLLFGMMAKKWTVNIIWFAIAELSIGFIAILMLPAFERLPLYFVNLFDLIVRNRVVLELIKFLTCSLVMIVPTILMGALFPMVTQICTRDYGELGRKVGAVYSVNTLGNILGAFMAGFILIPHIGIQKSIILPAVLNILVGCALILASQIPKLGYKVAFSLTPAIIGVVCALAIPPWDKMVVSSAPAVYAPMYAEARGDRRKTNIAGAGEKLLYYKEGMNATITVRERGTGTMVMAVDGKIDASNTGDMYTQLMLAHLPLLLSRDPKSALIIGLGSGVTLGASAQHELARIDCVEIEPAVVEASKFFNKENRDVLKDPRVNVIINDGRNYLFTTSQRYDVIISEPSNLWLAGIANLFSLDFYKICKKHLNPGGIMCQWSHIYYMSPEDMRIVVNTFRSAFPYTSIWSSTLGDILMIGSSEPLVIDYLQLAKHYNIEGVREDLQRLNIREPLALLSCYLLDEEGVAKFTAGSRINTDARPILEFSVPKSMYIGSSASNRDLLASFRTREFPKMENFDEERVYNRASFWYHLGVAYDYKEMTELARKYYKKAIATDAKFAPAYVGLALNLYKEKDAQGAIDNLKKAIEIDPSDADAYYNLAQIYQNQGFIDSAISNYESAVRLSPQKSKYREKLKELLGKNYKSP